MDLPVQPAEGSAGVSHNLRISSTSPNVSKNRRVYKTCKKSERAESGLHVAARKGDYDQCWKLIQEGASVNARDHVGWTPLHEACCHGHFKVASLLISNAADVNAAGENGDTPLHGAVAGGYEKLVQLLLLSKADRLHADNNGRLPIAFCRSECTEIHALLTSDVSPEIHVGCDSIASGPKTTALQKTISIAHSFLPNDLSTDGLSVGSGTDDRQEGAEGLRQTKGSRKHEVRAGDVDGIPVEAESTEVKTDSYQLYEDPPSVVARLALWREDSSSSSKTTEMASHDYDEDRPHSRDTHLLTSDADTRRAPRLRGTLRKDQYSPQNGIQKQTFGERRKPRGRTKGRGLSATSSTANIPTSSGQPEDVYEFRSSPESDVGIIKRNADLETVDMSSSPPCKRQRFAPVAASNSPAPSETSENPYGVENDVADVAPSVTEPNDDKGEVNADRKVPPLRISLPRTPSDDGATVTTVETAVSGVSTTGRRTTRASKALSKKQPSPEGTVIKIDDSVQRITRSKLRQAGRQLREQPVVSYETSTTSSKRRPSSWRRGSTTTATTASPMPASATSNTDEQNTSSNDAAEKNDGEENVVEGECEVKINENKALALSPMSKNSYEGYRGFRKIIEERWTNAVIEQSREPEKPANYKNFMIVKGNYMLAHDPGSYPPAEKIENDLMEKLTAKLRALCTEQYEKRKSIRIYHQVERERLQMQAESEVMRMLSRECNLDRELFSALRMIRESDLFNTGFLNDKPQQLPVVEISNVKAKFEKVADLLRKRQQMESDALYAEQVYVWNAAVQRSEDPSVNAFKDAVQRVPVIPVCLQF